MTRARPDNTSSPMPPGSVPPDWHQVSPEQVESLLGTSSAGLSQDEAERRLARVGPNRLARQSARPWWQRLLRQFNNLLIYVLLGAVLLAAAMQHWLDAGVILAVVLFNGVIGFLQEGRAEQALDAIRNLLSARAEVVRDGRRLTLETSELVPGDRVLLTAGDKVPADIRLCQASQLQIQEAALTGESLAVDKDPAPVAADAELGDRRCMAYSGTLVTRGQGWGLVVATGGDTELGRINRLLSTVEQLTTPLLRQMSRLAAVLTLVVLGMAVLVFVLGLWRGQDPQLLFMAVVSLAVAAIPEGLPTILTVALAIGVTRMARRHAIIRRLPAVETLGAVSVICSDKTGTLTRNEMQVTELRLGPRTMTVSGQGYDPAGIIQDGAGEAAPSAALSSLLLGCALCNDSQLTEAGGRWQVQGDPMEAALLALVHKGGGDPRQWRREYPRLAEIPFDSARKYMATLHRTPAGEGVLLLKGAPDVLLPLCTLQADGAPLDEADWQAQVASLAGRGLRVLGFALAEAPAGLNCLGPDLPLVRWRLLGLAGLMDPPRAEAADAIARCHRAGIQVKMITGDHGATASAIAGRLGLHNAAEVLTGRDIEGLSDAELGERVAEVNVFARTTPEHKLRLVQALQSRGAVVAMTGDGVNDAPALKRADVGVAMGQGGTEAAKEAGDMVLTDDNFATITRAVHEGRIVYDNLKKAVVFLLPINGGESLSIILALLLSLTLPIEPLQILWVNMVSSIGLAMALGFEAGEPGVMRRPPRDPGAAMLSPFLVWRILLVSALFTAGIFGVFLWARAQGLGEAYGRTMAVNTLVAMEVWYLFSVRYLYGGSLSWRGLRGTGPVLLAVALVLVLQLMFIYSPPMQHWFGSVALSPWHGLLTVLVGLLVFLILELEKWLITRWHITTG